MGGDEGMKEGRKYEKGKEKIQIRTKKERGDEGRKERK